MNLIWHIVHKDLRGARWLLAAFGLALTSHLLWPGLPLLMSLLLAACGTAWLVQEDPLLGGRARWVTMPIAPHRLRAAKVVAIALYFWLLPSLVQALALAWQPRTAHLVPGVMLELLCVNLFVPATAFMVAAVTHGLLRFLLGFVAVLALPATLNLSALPWIFGRSPTVDPNWEVVRSTVFLGGFLLVVGLVVKHQFQTRRTGRSQILAVLGMSCLWLALHRWEVVPR